MFSESVVLAGWVVAMSRRVLGGGEGGKGDGDDGLGAERGEAGRNVGVRWLFGDGVALIGGYGECEDEGGWDRGAEWINEGSWWSRERKGQGRRSYNAASSYWVSPAARVTGQPPDQVLESRQLEEDTRREAKLQIVEGKGLENVISKERCDVEYSFPQKDCRSRFPILARGVIEILLYWLVQSISPGLPSIAPIRTSFGLRAGLATYDIKSRLWASSRDSLLPFRLSSHQYSYNLPSGTHNRPCLTNADRVKPLKVAFIGAGD